MVYGMPREAALLGAADDMLPPAEIGRGWRLGCAGRSRHGEAVDDGTAC